ncbi:molybdenum cofactor biosynthesis protein MoaE [Rosettibacter firmus]|uniref:molybdenum cofactor biosynthesis protein MoaE n=1 Tax=Rosettibacter firmus TaxID=3111522 RepID=UPI00336BC133
MKYLTNKKINLEKIFTKIFRYNGGAIVVFLGKIRPYNNSKSIKYIFYESYEVMAEKLIQEYIQLAKYKWNLSDALIIHRIGKVKVNEISVIIITQHDHRKEAYKANLFLIEKIKHEIPIWKCEYYEDGTYEWNTNQSGKILKI